MAALVTGLQIRGLVVVYLELVEVADWFPEQEEHHMLARFGAPDTPTCPYCKNPMR
jgi:hypothetical protein